MIFVCVLSASDGSIVKIVKRHPDCMQRTLDKLVVLDNANYPVQSHKRDCNGRNDCKAGKVSPFQPILT